MKTLTEKQKNILEFIEEFLDKEGMAPTVYEIADRFDIKTSTVFAHLRALQRKKQLARTSKARSISITGRKKTGFHLPRGLFAIPLLGRVNAGAPCESIEYKEKDIYINSVPTGCTAENMFALRVQGESMRDLGIYDGDLVIGAQTRNKPKNGDIVVALVQGNEVTVKTLNIPDPRTIELHPANPAFKVQVYPAEEVCIQGKVVALQRTF